MVDPVQATCCCLCWLEGIRSEPIRNWDGFPICREHIAETLVRVNGHPVISPSPGFAAAPATLQ